MSEKHTPGPWVVKEQQGEIQIWEHRQIGGTLEQSCVAITNGEPSDLAKADARLIATAPDLLEELKFLRRAYVNMLEGGRDRILELGGQCDDVATMVAADQNMRSSGAAIAKATGQVS